MPSIDLQINHPAGLHARPAAEFVKTAAKFPCEIKVTNLTTPGKTVNAKSILSVLTLGVQQGSQVHIEANGDRDAEALQALLTLVQSNFGETA